MQRREFLRWLYKVTGGMVAIGIISETPPLRKINAALFSTKAHAFLCVPDGCSPDACTVSDSCAGKDHCSAADACQIDTDSICQIDKCNSDYQDGSQYINCNTDICTLDKSGNCNVDLCRVDMTSGCTNSDVCAIDNCSGGDTCATDNPPCESCTCESGECDSCACESGECDAMNHQTTRRDFAKAGLNKALQMLYRICTIVLFLGLAYGQSQAATVIDARDAVFNPAPAFNTNQNFATPLNVGPFLRDCDGDRILEADTNCDNSCAGDPEIGDYNNDGSYELPPGTLFPDPSVQGGCNFSCFFIPHDVSITTAEALNISASRDIVVFGAMNLPFGGTFNASQMIDLRTSAWNAGGPITFNTALDGTVDTSQTPVPPGGELPIPIHQGLCQDPFTIPTMTEWGMIIFMLLAGAGAVYYLRRQRGV